MLAPFKNVKGSVIKRGGTIGRYKFPIGKVIGGKVYLHVNYIDTLPYPEQAKKALAVSGLWKAKCLSYDPNKEVYMFSEAPNFNKHSEPAPEKSIRVEMDGDDVDMVGKPKMINQIWHHRWQWVDDNYVGFDVKEAYERSKIWAVKISNPSGSKRIWNKQLIEAGLENMIEEGFKFFVYADLQLLK